MLPDACTCTRRIVPLEWIRWLKRTCRSTECCAAKLGFARSNKINMPILTNHGSDMRRCGHELEMGRPMKGVYLLANGPKGLNCPLCYAMLLIFLAGDSLVTVLELD